MSLAARRTVGFILLFIAYQLPEGLGIHVLGSATVQAALMLAFLPIAYAIARTLLTPPGLAAYALEKRRRWVGPFVALFFLSVAGKLLGTAAGISLGITRVAPRPPSAAMALGIATTLFVTFFPSIAEDIVARGFLYRQVPALGGGARFVVASAIFFVLNHVFRLANGPAEWAMVFTMGLALATVVARTGSLWAALAMHWGWNVASFSVGDWLGADSPFVSGRLVSAGVWLVLFAVVALTPLPVRVRRPDSGVPLAAATRTQDS